MKLKELNAMTPDQLGHKYWELAKTASNHPNRNQRGPAKNNMQVVLDEFQRRLLKGHDKSIDSYKP